MCLILLFFLPLFLLVYFKYNFSSILRWYQGSYYDQEHCLHEQIQANPKQTSNHSTCCGDALMDLNGSKFLWRAHWRRTMWKLEVRTCAEQPKRKKNMSYWTISLLTQTVEKMEVKQKIRRFLKSLPPKMALTLGSWVNKGPGHCLRNYGVTLHKKHTLISIS